MRPIRVNKTKITFANAFNVDLFVFGGQNKLKYHEGTFFGVSLKNLDLSSNL